MTDQKSHTNSSGLNAGILLVLVGGLLLAHNLNMVDDLFEYWPVILIAIGVAKLLDYDSRPEARQ